MSTAIKPGGGGGLGLNGPAIKRRTFFAASLTIYLSKISIYLSQREKRARYGLGKVYRNSLYTKYINGINSILLYKVMHKSEYDNIMLTVKLHNRLHCRESLLKHSSVHSEKKILVVVFHFIANFHINYYSINSIEWRSSLAHIKHEKKFRLIATGVF